MEKYITIIVPCYNCEETIKENYKKILHFLKREKILLYQIILINDGSTDNTGQIITKIKNENLQVINNKLNHGKSYSIINALKLVKSKYVLLIDCDLPYINHLKNVFYNLENYDLIILNRKRKILKFTSIYSFFRSLIGQCLGAIVELNLKLNVNGDTQSGLKAFKFEEDINRTNFISKFFFFDIELIYYFKKRKLKIKKINTKEEASRKSSIKIFSVKNIFIIYEFLKVLSYLKRIK